MLVPERMRVPVPFLVMPPEPIPTLPEMVVLPEPRTSRVELDEEFIVPVMKKDFKDRNYRDIVGAAETILMTLEWEGINPYIVYELFKNFRPYVPVEF